MIDELQLLKEIFGDLTGFGMYAVGIYIAYKLIIFGGSIWLAKFLIEKLYLLFSSDITKQEASVLQSQNQNLTRELEDPRHKFKMEEENLKHMYKILKEKSDE